MEYKLTVLGSGGVGKTAFTIQMCSNHFVEYYDPTIESCYRRGVVIDDIACVLDVLDTAGQEEYSALRSQWIRSGQGFLMLFSLTDKLSFEEVEEFRRLVRHVKESDGEPIPPIVLIGNKSDLESEREVSSEELVEKGEKWGVPTFEASAKTKCNVEESFFCLVRLIRNIRPEEKDAGEGDSQPRRKKRACILY